MRAGRAFVATAKPIDDFYSDRSVREEFLAVVLAHRGHLAPASAIMQGHPSPFTSLYGELALLGTVPGDTTARAFERWLREGSPQSGGIPVGSRGLYFALPWWAQRADTLSLSRFAARMDSAVRSSRPPVFGEYFGDAARAFIELARSDTTAALTAFDALPRDVWAGTLNRLVYSQLLARRGKDREALNLLDRELPLLDRSRYSGRLNEPAWPSAWQSTKRHSPVTSMWPPPGAALIPRSSRTCWRREPDWRGLQESRLRDRPSSLWAATGVTCNQEKLAMCDPLVPGPP